MGSVPSVTFFFLNFVFPEESPFIPRNFRSQAVLLSLSWDLHSASGPRRQLHEHMAWEKSGCISSGVSGQTAQLFLVACLHRMNLFPKKVIYELNRCALIMTCSFSLRKGFNKLSGQYYTLKPNPCSYLHNVCFVRWRIIC